MLIRGPLSARSGARGLGQIAVKRYLDSDNTENGHLSPGRCAVKTHYLRQEIISVCYLYSYSYVVLYFVVVTRI